MPIRPFYSRRKSRSKPYLLLELLLGIALLLITFSAIIRPAFDAYRSSMESANEIRLGLWVNRFWVDLWQDLYEGQVEWGALEGQQSLERDFSGVSALGYTATLHVGKKQKGKPAGESPLSPYHLLSFKLEVTAKGKERGPKIYFQEIFVELVTGK